MDRVGEPIWRRGRLGQAAIGRVRRAAARGRGAGDASDGRHSCTAGSGRAMPKMTVPSAGCGKALPSVYKAGPTRPSRT